MINKIIQGDCLVELKTLAENSVDSIVTDPPYELGFMGKSWDNTGIANNPEVWAECLRVLKPGGHLLAFSGTRTYHRMASAIEDAGFEVRDMIEWVYGSGFPKSLNIGKAIQKGEGELKIKGYEPQFPDGTRGATYRGQASADNELSFTSKDTSTGGLKPIYEINNEWEGWGTALKPAHEPICMARKPLAEKTVAENCLKYGTGGINIDESRVDFVSEEDRKESTTKNQHADFGTKPMTNNNVYGDYSMIEPKNFNPTGRFPANLIHDNSEEVRECFPDAGKGNGNGAYNYAGREYDNKDTSMFNGDKPQAPSNFNDSGNASRFFKSIIYQAKSSKAERNKGCEGLEEKEGIRTNAPRENENVKTPTRANNHPTVKPIALMEYLIKMVTPKGGIVLDPFAGSGSTLIAAKQNGYQYIGIEMTPEYIPIIEARLK